MSEIRNIDQDQQSQDKSQLEDEVSVRSTIGSDEKSSKELIIQDNSDNESDSGSSTSTESLVERSRKYLTDEAGIIILKQKKLPKQKFDIKLNFDVDTKNRANSQLKYKIDDSGVVEQVVDTQGNYEGVQICGSTTATDVQPVAAACAPLTWSSLTGIKDGETTVVVSTDLNQSGDRALSTQIQNVDAISSVVHDAARTVPLPDKENIYRQNFGGAVVNLPVLRTVNPVEDASKLGEEEFEEESVESGKLVLYLTEKQLEQLLKQRAVIVGKSGRVVRERSEARTTVTSSNLASNVTQQPASTFASVNIRPADSTSVITSNVVQGVQAPAVSANLDQYFYQPSNLSEPVRRRSVEEFVDVLKSNVQNNQINWDSVVRTYEEEPSKIGSVSAVNDFVDTIKASVVLEPEEVEQQVQTEQVRYFINSSEPDKLDRLVQSLHDNGDKRWVQVNIDAVPGSGEEVRKYQIVNDFSGAIDVVEDLARKFKTGEETFTELNVNATYQIAQLSPVPAPQSTWTHVTHEPSTLTQYLYEPSNTAAYTYEPAATTTTQYTNEPVAAATTQYTYKPVAAATTQYINEPVAAATTQYTYEPVAAATTQYTYKPVAAATTQYTNEPVAAATTQYTYEPVAAATTQYTYKPVAAATTQYTNEPVAAATTQYTYEPVAAATTQYTYEPVAAATTQYTNEPVVATTTQYTYEPVAAATTQYTYEPVAAATTQYTNEPVVATTTQYTYEPVAAATTQYTYEPVAAATTQYTYEPVAAATTQYTYVPVVAATTQYTNEYVDSAYTPYVPAQVIVEPQAPREVERLQYIDRFITKVKQEPSQTVYTKDDKQALEALEAFSAKLKRILAETYKTQVPSAVRPASPPRGVVQPPRVVPAAAPVATTTATTTTAARQPTRVRKITKYSYLDNYEPTTRVYTLDDDQYNSTTAGIGGLRVHNTNGKTPSNYISYHEFNRQSNIDHYFNKPFETKLNDATVLVNQGLSNRDYVQLHPLLTDRTDIRKVAPADASPNPEFPRVTRPVMIGSEGDDYSEIAKHFGGLKIIDFPVYVQGLELKQDNSSPNRSASQRDFSNTHESNIRNVSPDGFSTGVHQDYVKQAATYADNVHYIRVNGADVQVR